MLVAALALCIGACESDFANWESLPAGQTRWQGWSVLTVGQPTKAYRLDSARGSLVLDTYYQSPGEKFEFSYSSALGVFAISANGAFDGNHYPGWAMFQQAGPFDSDALRFVRTTEIWWNGGGVNEVPDAGETVQVRSCPVYTLSNQGRFARTKDSVSGVVGIHGYWRDFAYTISSTQKTISWFSKHCIPGMRQYSHIEHTIKDDTVPAVDSGWRRPDNALYPPVDTISKLQSPKEQYGYCQCIAKYAADVVNDFRDTTANQELVVRQDHVGCSTQPELVVAQFASYCTMNSCRSACTNIDGLLLVKAQNTHRLIGLTLPATPSTYATCAKAPVRIEVDYISGEAQHSTKSFCAPRPLNPLGGKISITTPGENPGTFHLSKAFQNLPDPTPLSD